MTCIVGIVDKKTNKTIIGGDSASSNGSNVFVRKDAKVFKSGEFIIGCTSSFRMIQLLMYSFNPPEINGKEIYKYMCTDFINSIRECFRDGGFLQKFSDGDEKGGVSLVAYKDRLFRIEDDFQVAETVNGFDSIGSGQDFALGALHILSNQNIPTEDKVIKALDAAEYLAVGVRKPFVIIST